MHCSFLTFLQSASNPSMFPSFWFERNNSSILSRRHIRRHDCYFKSWSVNNINRCRKCFLDPIITRTSKIVTFPINLISEASLKYLNNHRILIGSWNTIIITNCNFLVNKPLLTVTFCQLQLTALLILAYWSKSSFWLRSSLIRCHSYFWVEILFALTAESHS